MRSPAILTRPRLLTVHLDQRLVAAVGRLPLRVQSKLLLAFLATAILLVVVGLFGLRVIGESNDRVATLAAVQQRAATYRELQTDASQLRLLLGLRTGLASADNRAYAGQTSTTAIDTAGLVEIDGAIRSTLARPGRPTDLTRPGFVPPPDEESSLAQIQADYQSLATTMDKVVAYDQLRASGQPADTATEGQVFDLVIDLQSRTDGLAQTTQSAALDLAAQNAAAFADSQRLMLGVAAVSIVLALFLGYVLSLSLVGPIRRMETRLAGIAAGDFSDHVDVPNRDELGSLAGNLNRMNDELGRLYTELDAASRHKSEFLANMSHELRTPLNAVIGFSDVLGEQMFGPLNETQQQYVRDIQGAGRHLLSLINDILDLSKVEAGRMELALTEVSIPGILEAGLTMHRTRAERAGITLVSDVDSSVGTVQADERKVRQVVFNLLANAVKFTPAGGRITVSARREAHAVEIGVADTGIGIAAEDQDRIFDAFQQAGGPAAGSVEGTGLGLALSRRFVELHGGRLWVESSPGQGSAFRFTLPLAAAP